MVELKIFRLKNSIIVYCILSKSREGFFIKILNSKLYSSEKKGFSLLSKYYKTSKLIFKINLLVFGVIVYKYIPSIGFNKGLVLDNILCKEEYFINKIIFLYKTAFRNTATISKDNYSENLFYFDRINSRIRPWYDNKISDLSLLLLDIYRFQHTRNEKDKLMIVSQCDPSDMNLTSEGHLLDYSSGGYISIEAEFASFIVINLIFAELLSPKYNIKAYIEHDKIFSNLDIIKIDGNQVNHYISRLRLEYINNYIEHVFFFIIKEKEKYVVYKDFCMYFSIRILSVFNIEDIDNTDKMVVMHWINIINRMNNFYELKQYFKTYDKFK